MIFQGIDGKLTIYALANGMDLVKTDGYRQLEWYRDGRDRGIRLQADDEGRVQVQARAWKGDPDEAEVSPLDDPREPDALLSTLSTVLDEATEAANRL